MMSSQSSVLRDIVASAETTMPVTPLPRHATLPDAGHSSQSQTEHINRAKAASPTSRTPPPSSQRITLPRPSLTPTPPPASLPSTPPLTIEAHQDATTTSKYVSEECISQASHDQLRSMVHHLLPSLREARADAAHHKLQYQMLSMESADTIQRIQVEMGMAQRELDVLQGAEQLRLVVQQPPPPIRPVVDPNIRPVHVDLYNAMVRDIQDLRAQNNQSDTTIAKQKRMIVQQEGEIATLNDRITLLRERLQENRDHLNRYRRPNAALDTTPRSEQSTPYRGSGHKPSSSSLSHDPRSFDALLRASSLINKDPPGTPTPTSKRKRGQAHAMPLTPQTAQPRLSRNPYETPPTSRTAHFKVPQSAPVARIPKFNPQPLAADNTPTGHESDGTVSAVDDSEAETEVPEHDDDLRESQASLLASHLLRTPTRPRHEIHASDQPSTMQGRLFGQVRKTGVQRQEGERQAKRAKAADNTAGLGISGAREEQH